MKKCIKLLFLCVIALFGTNGAFADFSFNDMELKFAQVSDVHLSDSPDTTYKVLSHSKDLFSSVISELNNTKGLDFVAFTGDMVNEPTKDYYKDFFMALSKLNYPSILVFGNHDSVNSIYQGEEGYLNKELVLKIITHSNPYQQYGKSYFAFSPSSGYRVIVLDTTLGHEFQSNGYVSEEQLQFLDQELSECLEKVVIIFQHHPLVEPFKSADHKIANSDAYFAVLKKYEKIPIAIFAGHYHAAKIVRKGNVLHVASPALVTYPNAYRTVSITNYHDRVDFIFNFHETALKNVQALSKSSIIASNVFQGLPGDRNNTVMIRKGYVPKIKLTKEEKMAQKAEAKRLKEEAKAKKKEAKALDKEAKKEVKRQMKEYKEQRKLEKQQAKLERKQAKKQLKEEQEVDVQN